MSSSPAPRRWWDACSSGAQTQWFRSRFELAPTISPRRCPRSRLQTKIPDRLPSYLNSSNDLRLNLGNETTVPELSPLRVLRCRLNEDDHAHRAEILR